MIKKLLLLLPLCGFAQTPIDVTESTLKVSMLGQEEAYYGFAAGDQVILNFDVMDGKELKEIEMTELPSASRFMDYKTKKIENKIINIHNTGIYKFRLYNSSLGARICKLKLQRIPSSDQTKNFNTSVYWKTIRDTIYRDTTETYLERSEDSFTEVYNAMPQISSKNAFNGNSNYQVIDFQLPENTTSWSFYIGTGNEGKTEYERAKKAFLKTGVQIAATYGPLAALAANGTSYFMNVQGEDNVKYWFINNLNDLNLFRSGQSFHTFKSGDVVTEASQMFVPKTGKIYVAILNDNTLEPIQITIKVIAFTKTEIWNTRMKKLISFKDRKEPYLIRDE